MIMVPLCVGIDPAPSGKAKRGNAVVILDAEKKLDFEESMSHSDLRDELKKWKKKESVLLAWDAPLTGPADPDSLQAGARNSELQTDFTTREIERVFSKDDWALPNGISVQGYAGCQHWALTRNLLGLPRVGTYDKKPEDLPFNLLVKKPAHWRGQNVVEVHPALAMWLWLRDENPQLDFRYKTSKGRTACQRISIRTNLLEKLLDIWAGMGVPPNMLPSNSDRHKFENSPDLLDALVAAILAYLWVTPLDGVELLGDQRKGTFLLPTKTGLPSLGQASS
jgi:predicted RNase H-like nuclease